MGSDFVSVGTLIAGLAGIVAAAAGVLLGLGMMLAPVRHDDPQVGAICMLATAILCGTPGVALFFLGALKLARRDARGS